jgi:hypothetical protein
MEITKPSLPFVNLDSRFVEIVISVNHYSMHRLFEGLSDEEIEDLVIDSQVLTDLEREFDLSGLTSFGLRQ